MNPHYDRQTFSSWFAEANDRAKVLLSTILAMELRPSVPRRQPLYDRLLATLQRWLATENESLQLEAFEAYSHVDEAFAEAVDSTTAESLLVTLLALPTQVLAWRAVENGTLQQNKLHSGYHEGDRWFRQTLWEASLDKGVLQRFCLGIETGAINLDSEYQSPFAAGIGDFENAEQWPADLM